MIKSGTAHFVADLAQVGGDPHAAETIYKALRCYNSGSMNEDDLSDGKGATASYVSDIANRLRGPTN